MLYINLKYKSKKIIICLSLILIILIVGCKPEVVPPPEVSVEKDLTACERITDEFDKDMCFSQVAEAKQDETICEKVGWVFARDGCYKEIGIAKKDEAVCNLIEEEVYRYNCLAVAKKDPALCDKTDDWKTLCLQDVAIENDDETICPLILDTYDRDACYILIAMNRNNNQLCEKVEDETERQLCTQNIG